MLDSGKRKSSCSLAEEIVSYIYDEMPGSNRIEFEAHLADCSTCPEEIAAYSSVSASIQEWREAGFAQMPTPPIELPREVVSAQMDVSNEKSTWAAAAVRLFDLSPMILKTSAAFGALAVLVGFGWFLMNGLPAGNKNVVEKKEDAIPDRKILETKAPKETEITVNNNPEPSDAPKQAPETVAGSTLKIAPVKVKRSSVKTVPKRTVIATKRNTANKQRKKNVDRPVVYDEVPRLTEELAVEETDELRLTDLLGELGSKDE